MATTAAEGRIAPIGAAEGRTAPIGAPRFDAYTRASVAGM